MDKKNKQVVKWIVGVVFLLAVCLGFYFSETQNDFGANIDNQENMEEFENNEHLATVSVTFAGEEIEGSPVEIELKSEIDLMTYMVQHFDVIGADEGFITSINDVEQDESEGLYWLYYINEEMPSVGAGDYIVEDGDLIEWKLESFE